MFLWFVENVRRISCQECAPQDTFFSESDFQLGTKSSMQSAILSPTVEYFFHLSHRIEP